MSEANTADNSVTYRTSEETATLFAALNLAQAGAGNAPINQENSFFNSGYADLPSYLEVTNPSLHANGLSCLQGATSLCELPTTGLVYSRVTTRLAHKSGEWIEWDTDMPIAKLDSHGATSAQTYARRASLAGGMAIFHGTDDDGNAASVQTTAKAPRKPPLTELKELHKEALAKVEPYRSDQAAHKVGLMMRNPQTTPPAQVDLAIEYIKGVLAEGAAKEPEVAAK